ncbi:L,D-transpeptidase [Frankia sp. AgB32]|uniref:L,D-transpeptidase n=1 Tax=Frankia sp. AgB32 TaxID=631119 RepID=UPI00200D115E|nr:L,D-transpeptidase [Frankia sp. AgB32]MCK9898016.1 L,D-transpeptidase [Frankia sp. AgB32]
MGGGGGGGGARGGGGGGGGGGAPPPRPVPTPTVRPTAAHPSPARPPAEAYRHLVAHALGDGITWYRAPEADTPGGRLANPNRQGVPLVFAVEWRQAGWLRVRLPVRPNGLSGWLRAAAVSLSETPYDLRVDRSEHRLTVSRDGRVLVRLPVGIGTGSTPTPVGEFYLTELLRPASPQGPWGPYAFGLSGFSDVITQFNGDDGIIGLHGTNRPDLIGTDASLGCIRLRNDDIERLAGMLPLGTPISITD